MLSFVVAGAAFAQTVDPNAPTDEAMEQEMQSEKTAIAMEEVPAEVQDGLQETNIQTAEVEEVYKLDLTDETLYEFVVTSEGVKWAIQFDTEGNYVNKKALS
ncbi:hypothetical protein BGP76_05275 [Reichenbachiella sp. MSK19-1]|nr:hypothetical protein BGP76_05275 [Reichenbachiella sp. MSK19-1]